MKISNYLPRYKRAQYIIFIIIIAIVIVVYRIYISNYELTNHSIYLSTHRLTVYQPNYKFFHKYHLIWRILTIDRYINRYLYDIERIGYTNDYICITNNIITNKCNYLSINSNNNKQFNQFININYNCNNISNYYSFNYTKYNKTNELIHLLDTISLFSNQSTNNKRIDIIKLDCFTCIYDLFPLIQSSYPSILNSINQLLLTIYLPDTITTNQINNLHNIFNLLDKSNFILIRIDKCMNKLTDNEFDKHIYKLIDDYIDIDSDYDCPSYIYISGLPCIGRCMQFLYIYHPMNKLITNRTFSRYFHTMLSFLLNFKSNQLLSHQFVNRSNYTNNYLSSYQMKHIPGKTIWLLWLQGWDQAPWMVRQIARSWAFHNPDWNIVYLSYQNLHRYLNISYLNNPMITDQAKSDIIRLNLLYKYGGVWADSTMVCFENLDHWLDIVMNSTGFWMYHGGFESKYPCSWFIISQRQNYIISKWKEQSDIYWNTRNAISDHSSIDLSNHSYFWMDHLFQFLMRNDRKFLDEWLKVPYISCDGYGQSHMLAGKVLDRNVDLINQLTVNPPYTLKLSHHNFPKLDYQIDNSDSIKLTNGYTAIYLSNRIYLNITHYMVLYNNNTLPINLSTYQSIVTSTKTNRKNVLLITCNDRLDSSFNHNLLNLYQKNNQLVVYDSCNFCQDIDSRIICRYIRS